MPFASFSQPVIGMAAAPGRLLVTNYCGDPRVIYSLDSAGTVSVFSTLLPRGGGCYEQYIAISPGFGGFPANHVYVTQGPNIVQTDSAGTFLGIFATIPSLPVTHNGIAFDHTGSFGFDMIVTGSDGQLWRVNSLGVPTMVATGFCPATCAEGPDVAPISFAPYGGDVITSSESNGLVYAVSPAGAVSVVSSWPSSEFVHFVPPNPCAFGTSGGSLFDVIYPYNVIKFPTSDLSGLSGNALVTSEFSGTIGDMSSVGGSIVTSTFQTGLGQQEGATIVDCAVPPVQQVKVSKFYTDTSNNPLPLDNNGNPRIDVVLANGIVRSTNPGEIIAWVNVTNTAGAPVQSLKVNETLPVDWIVAPTWLPAKGAVHVYYANTTSLSTNPEITDPKNIAVTSGNPQTVILSIPNLNATGIGHPLLAGQSILLAVKLDYGLDQTSQPFSSYPRNYTDVASAAIWTGVSYTGTEASATGSASFIAYAKLLGDVDGDNNVNIVDVATVAYAYGSRAGDPRWSPAADFDNSGVIDINDVAIVAFYYGTSI